MLRAMSQRPRVLYVVEALIGFRIKEDALSNPVKERFVDLMRLDRRIENMKEETERLNTRRRMLDLFILGSAVVGLFGLAVGLIGLFQGSLGWVYGVIAIWAGVGIFIIDTRLYTHARRMQSTVRENTAQLERLTVALDSGLKSLSQQVLEEPPDTRTALD